MADFILQDILAEILIRLPLHSLLRFKCVQKSWYHLIRSPYFIDLHFNHQENKNKYLFFQGRFHGDFFFHVDDKQCNEYNPGLRFPIPKFLETGFVFKIHGTCRGLICFSAENRINSGLNIVYLWNPATRMYRSLPCSPGTFSDDQYHRSFTLGYFPKITDYKVIKFQSYDYTVGEDFRAPSVCIYSLSTDSWKTVGEDIIGQLSSYRKLYNSVIVNGVAYWVGIREPLLQVIVCFDTETEKIREIILPPQYGLDLSMGQISSFNLVQHFDEVLLSVVNMNTFARSLILDIFSLGKGDGEDVVYTQKVSIDLAKVSLWPIGFRYSGEIVLFDYDNTRGGFLSYDPEKKIATKILDDSWELWSYAHLRVPEEDDEFVVFEGEEEYIQLMYVNSFAENLVSLGDKQRKVVN
ncbi:hypothetical protein POM88_033016 [Heracleum sosnowskyi]|uniref:F-box domain-containing protein n=1 Tax=Heracleum sosnowskyi TaxID=360622 RepID=A0AAD8I1C1_9APIA|nr:hypothetical protein POM88_033016 [Heracleum sosnowskyi]